MKYFVIGGFIAALSAVSIHWILTTPTPHNVSPRYRVLDFMHRLVLSLSEYASWIGIGNTFSNYRAIAYIYNSLKPRPKLEKTIDIQETEIEGARVKVYSPPSASEKLLPGLIYFHGGGFTLGIPEFVETLCLTLADRLDAKVLSVGYKQAPEYTFPTPFDDCYLVAVHVINNAESYGIDQKHIALAGDSAGGNLAAAVTQSVMSLVKSCRKMPISGQVLINPTLQWFDFNLPSALENKDMFILTQYDVARFWSVYMVGNSSLIDTFLQGNHSFHLRNTVSAKYLGLPNEDEDKIIAAEKNAKETIPPHVIEAITDARASPIMAPKEDLKWLPPTFVLTSEYDVIRDDGKHYVSRLRAANVDVKHEHYEGVHDFLFFELIPEPTELAKKATDDVVEFLKEVFSVKD